LKAPSFTSKVNQIHHFSLQNSGHFTGIMVVEVAACHVLLLPMRLIPQRRETINQKAKNMAVELVLQP
jgi:hypothetical protein